MNRRMPNGTYGGVKGWRKSTLFDRNPLWKSDRKEGKAMDVFQFMQIVGFALAFFVAGYSLGKRK